MGPMHAQRSNFRSTKTLKSAFNITPVQSPQSHLIAGDPMPPTSSEILSSQPPQTHLIPDDTPTPTYADILQKRPSQSSLPLPEPVFQ